MQRQIHQLLIRIDHGNDALLKAGLSTQDQLKDMMGLLQHLVDLLLPKENRQDGPRLEELLARMIAQQSAIIELQKQTLACVARTETHLLGSPGKGLPC